eukprot:TRINITY_DN22016_c0_g1_i1.p1 TRINITY_DN22016_c0_g1~~TRINITY_DN22016_c0_g1_i1.p1  ORF type:complete len:120 (-),score=30.81 TRINITY_DN22016_c0_g1_i1:92-451(-)
MDVCHAYTDFQIQLLKEQLVINTRALQDRDEELMHYKELASTLQALLLDTASSYSSSSDSDGYDEEDLSPPVQAKSTSPSGSCLVRSGSVPNYKAPAKLSSKTKKFVSFHNDVQVHTFH